MTTIWPLSSAKTAEVFYTRLPKPDRANTDAGSSESCSSEAHLRVSTKLISGEYGHVIRYAVL